MIKFNLFCLPFAGGSKYSYNGLVQNAPKGMSIVPLELPGRGARITEVLKTDIRELAEDVYSQIRDKTDQPYAIFGHSMGGLLAYLVTQKIVDEGLIAPVHLFLSGCNGPSAKREESIRYLLSKTDFINKIREYDGSPDEILNNEDLMDFFEPILRKDFQAVETFVYRQVDPFNVPITVFLGKEDKTTYAKVEMWRKETTGEMDIVEYPGKHFFIFNNEKEILRIISKKVLTKIFYL